MKKFKLFILRIAFVIALSISWVGTLFTKKAYHFPVEWLLHYLVGTGRDKVVSAKVIEEAKAVFVTAINKNHLGNEELGGIYAVNHSTLYEGSGFHERPSLFYILGCFIFNYEPRTGRVWGSDHYDWHSDPEQDKYFTSPLGYNKWIVKACDIMGRIFGDDLFVTERSDFDHLIVAGGYDGQAAISNKLWEVLKAAGAREFNTVFEGYISLNKETVLKAVRDHHENGDYKAVERYERIIKRSVINKYTCGSYDESDVYINGRYDNYIKATIDIYSDWDSGCNFINKEINYYKYDDNTKIIKKVYGYELSLIKAVFHYEEFDQQEIKNRLLAKRGKRIRPSRRSSRPKRQGGTSC